MDTIDDKRELDSILDMVRECAGALPETQPALIELLGTLIDDARVEFTGEKFDMPRRMGDLDDADGITHLLADYPPAVPPGKLFREAFLNTLEEAAAHHLLKLYAARDSLNLGFDLPKATIREIEATGIKLILSRLEGPAHDSAIRNRKEKQGGKKGGENKAKIQKPKIDAWHAQIQKRAKSMKGGYSKTEALDVLEREFPGYSRRQLANIVSSVFPPKPRRAKSSE